MKFEDVEISGFNGTTLLSKTLGITFKNVNIYDNKMSGSILDVTSNITAEKVATLSIVNNKMQNGKKYVQ